MTGPDPAGERRGHRPITVIAEDVHALVAAARDSDAGRIKELIEPYFVETDWCCLFAVAGGLMAILTRGMPPIPPGARLAVSADPGASAAEVAWGRMVAANLRHDTAGAGDIFAEAIAGNYVGELMAVAVTTTGDADKRRKAILS